ncbi:MAG: hypothetical protein AAF432_08215 [Planctomycetota bacterium]
MNETKREYVIDGPPATADNVVEPSPTARCPNCDHIIENIRATTCSECGLAIRAAIHRAAGGTMTYWWIGVFGASIAVLMSPLVGITDFGLLIATARDSQMRQLVANGMMPQGGLPDGTMLITSLLFLSIAFIALARLLGRRHRFAHLPIHVQQIEGAIGLSLPFIILIVLYVISR